LVAEVGNCFQIAKFNLQLASSKYQVRYVGWSFSSISTRQMLTSGFCRCWGTSKNSIKVNKTSIFM